MINFCKSVAKESRNLQTLESFPTFGKVTHTLILRTQLFKQYSGIVNEFLLRQLQSATFSHINQGKNKK